jgi:glutathione synthase/RimK-type ligase-like ATP-grasp enzyme
MILLWGVPGDDPLDQVWAAVRRLRPGARLIDQRHVRGVDVVICPDGRASGRVETPDGPISLDQVSAAYVRPQQPVPERERDDAALVAWADLTPATVLNRPAAMAANNSKPYQLAALARLGFDVPDTLVTTDADEVLRFRERFGRVVYKSVSGVRSIVSEVRDEHLERLTDVASGPTQFQEYVPGEDVRVHVVGDELFATAVRCAADDYRYASRTGQSLSLAATDLPPDVAQRCRAASTAFGLPLTGIDLRHTPDGRWVCFEANPSPGFTFYQEATGQPIADAVARLLVRAAGR